MGHNDGCRLVRSFWGLIVVGGLVTWRRRTGVLLLLANWFTDGVADLYGDIRRCKIRYATTIYSSSIKEAYPIHLGPLSIEENAVGDHPLPDFSQAFPSQNTMSPPCQSFTILPFNPSVCGEHSA